MQVAVFNVFQHNMGVFVTLEFPAGVVPKYGVTLKKGALVFLIKGVSYSRNRPHDEDVATKWNCLLANSENVVEVGDVLELLSQ